MASTSIRPSTNEAIINAAISTLAANPGASINEIAAKAGVGRATLYRQYKTREDLILAIQERSMRETEAAVLAAIEPDMSALDTLNAMFTAVIPLGDRFHFLNNNFAFDERQAEMYQRELDWVNSLVKRLKQENVVAAEIPDSWATAQMNQLVWTAWQEVGEGRIASADAPALALRTFVNGMSSK